MESNQPTGEEAPSDCRGRGGSAAVQSGVTALLARSLHAERPERSRKEREVETLTLSETTSPLTYLEARIQA